MVKKFSKTREKKIDIQNRLTKTRNDKFFSNLVRGHPRSRIQKDDIILFIYITNKKNLNHTRFFFLPILQVANCTSDEGCVNTDGSYECTCKPGHFINSTGDCVDVDECADNHNLVCHKGRDLNF